MRAAVLERRQEVLDREHEIVSAAWKVLGSGSCKVADVCCGRFGLLEGSRNRLEGMRANIIGIDLDRDDLARNPHVASRLCANCYALPFPDRSIDLVVCRWAFEHLDKPEAAMREFSRVLKKGGFLYVKTPNLWNYAMIVSSVTPTAFHNFYRISAGGGGNTPTFYRANTKSKLRKLATGFSFAIHTMETSSYSYMYYAFNRPLFFAMRGLSHLMACLIPQAQQTLLCLMQKVEDNYEARNEA